MPKCFVCPLTIDNLSMFRSHVRFHNVTKKDPVFCVEEGCGKLKISNLSNLMRHYSADHGFGRHATSGSVEVQHCIDFDDPQVEMDIHEMMDTGHGDHESLSEDTNLCALIEEDVDIFLSKLYGNPRITRKQVQEIVSYTQNLLGGIGNVLKPPILDLLRDANATPDITFQWEDIFEFLKKPLEAVRSEYMRLKTFKKEGTYIEPIEIHLGTESGVGTSQGEHCIQMLNLTAHFIPLRESLKKFFTQPEVMPIIQDFLTEIYKEKNVLSHFLNAETWKTYVSKSHSKFILPLFYYSDEFECGNSLGSHKTIHKVNGNYVCMPFLPPYLSFPFQNIFMVYLHHSADSKMFSSKKLYQCVIDEFVYLYNEGIFIETTSFTGTVYFKLALFCGDNLGMHQMLGFIEGFTANFPCRFCRIHRNDMRLKCVDDPSLRRNPSNYDDDLSKNDQSKSGIRERCVWHDIPDFHCTEAGGFDLFHDVLEGNCVFSFQVIIPNLIQEGHFDLDTLNSRMLFFNYGSIDKDSKPPPLTYNQKGKINISLSASEMFIFTKYFGLIIGDKVPEGNQTWELYLLLRRIMDIIMSSEISYDDLKLLKLYIKRHHELFIALTLKKRLKPKMHHMIHYPELIRLFGPPIFFWAMRFEAFHRFPKSIAYSISTNRNLTLSLAIRAQFVFHSFLKSHAFMKNRFNSGPPSSCCLADVPGFDSVENAPFSDEEKIQVVPWVTIKGTIFKSKMLIVIGYHDHLPVFSEIKTILLTTSGVAFLCTKIETINFDNHFYSYEIMREKDSYELIQFSALTQIFPTVINRAAGKLFVTYKYGI